MTEKQRREKESAERLLHALGQGSVALKCDDRPDILASVDRRRIAIEVTDLHPDERITRGGSLLRAEEEKLKDESPDKPYFLWLQAAFLSAFQLRVVDKIKRANKYSETNYDELWLLVSSQLPDAVASTYVFSPFISLDDLNRATHALLCISRFGRAYLHLQLDDILYEWSSSETWQIRKLPTGQASAGDLWFRNLDEEWFRDPVGKMEAEIHNVFEEFRQNRSS